MAITDQVLIQRESQEQLEVPVFTTQDPTTQVVEFSFPALGSRPSSWTAGEWLDGAAAGAGRDWRATALTPLIGATGADVVLTSGTYSIFMRITDDPEVPVVNCGQVRVA